MSINATPQDVNPNLGNSPKEYKSGAPPTHPIHGHVSNGHVNSTEKQQPKTRASQMLSGQNVSVSLRRKFNLGDYESLDVEYTLGGQLPDEVDPLWAIDDLTDELRERIESGVGPEIATREAIAKESFLTTPRNQQQRIIQLHLQEMGVDVDALRELLQMKVNLRDLANERKAIQNVNGHKNGKVPA